jgi:hypothetical protein
VSIAKMGLILMFDDKECFIYQGLDRIVGQWIHNWTTSLDWYTHHHSSKIQNMCNCFTFSNNLWDCHLRHLNQRNVRSMGSHHIVKGIPLNPWPHEWWCLL